MRCPPNALRSSDPLRRLAESTAHAADRVPARSVILLAATSVLTYCSWHMMWCRDADAIEDRTLCHLGRGRLWADRSSPLRMARSLEYLL
jgi:hypothetical protein